MFFSLQNDIIRMRNVGDIDDYKKRNSYAASLGKVDFNDNEFNNLKELENLV